MFLSNPAKSFLAAVLFSTVCGGCGFFKGLIVQAPAAAPETNSGVPFAAKDPDVFQAEFVNTSGDSSSVSFFARKGVNWRLDTAVGSENSTSLIRTDKMYSVSRANKTFAEIPTDQAGPEPDLVSDMTEGLLKQANNAKFEEIGRDGNVIRYKVSIGDNAASQAVVYFDQSIGMIVREEFFSLRGQTDPQPEFTFEMRDLKMDVSDDVFAIPAGLRKVVWTDLSPTKTKK